MNNYPIIKITIFNIAIYVLIWLILGWIYVILFQKLPHPWHLIACGFIATLFFMSLIPFYYMIKSLKDPDVIEATKIGLTIKRYYIYKKIWDEILQIYREDGINDKTNFKIDKLIAQVPNINEWRKFSNYQEEKYRKDSMENLFQDLKKSQND